ncbi:MAG: lipid A biosynthesis acyltransferase [Flavobacteriales bacterium CG18_big_fil_WC_8_21_14_2_50_32_9]|nr:MAG: lipid A biosynthesis acyltransferase [Flavobacteriales bacterium CG18_big_fil_WC_8_21_14_2_50_32_9]PJC62264.1 MAG: lipid A biosynthesis acyltransferase [Flavobacteriales bacterium CG_4_9_14_0_2_um_filter_32_27]
MSKWSGKSKGSVLGYRIFLSVIKIFGLPSTYFLLKTVTYFYYKFDIKSRNSIEEFYLKRLKFDIKKTKKITRENFFYFGQTLVDRAAFLIGKGNKFTFDFNNEQCLIDLRNEGKGGILLSGHVGNWETAGNLLTSRITSTINVLMLDEEEKKIKKYLEVTTGGSKFNIIPIKNDLSHVIKIHNALSNNEFVAIHADRYIEGAKFIELDFFGKKAKFPLGPFIVASKFKAPVTFVFAVKEKKYHYLLSATTPIKDKQTPEEIAKKFVKEFENKILAHPEQWFNYFDFYK